MKFKEWRSDPERVKNLREVLATPILIEAIDCVRNQPSLAATSVTPHYAHIRLGRLEGRILAFEELEFLATPPTRANELKPGYAAEE